MPRSLPPNPSLRFLRKQAKDILKSHAGGRQDACEWLRVLGRFTSSTDRDILEAAVSLADVQFAMAVSYGFGRWSELATAVEQLADQPAFLDRVRGRYTEMATKTSDAWFTFHRWPYMVDLANKLESWLEASPPARILDLACGTGAPTAALALKGYRMTGLDLTPAMLDVAQKGAQARDAHVEWICQDMRKIVYDGVFDYVLLRDVIFGVFETREEDVDLVRRIARALKPGGRCLFEVYNKEFAKTHGVQGDFFYDQRLDTFVARDPAATFTNWRLYSPEEWKAMLEACGLQGMKMVCGWKWKQDPPPPPWRADFIVAQKE